MAPSSATTTSVQVALRIRPQTSQDAISIPARFQRPVIHATSSTSVTIEASPAAMGGGLAAATATGSPAKKQSFTFDQVHQPSTTQYEMFTSTAEPLTNRFLEGYNCTILAYGQTSSGKTFTMTGIDLDADPTDPNNGMGIIPRAVSTIFSRARQMREERAGSWSFSLKGSFIEIYNEDLIDLLSMDDGSGGRREVQIREDKDGHIIWGGLREVTVKNPNEVMSLIRQGTAIRRTNETDMNAQSSRSHAIFSLTLTQKKFTGSGPPPRSSSPMPPAGRSPSRLIRPSSVYNSSPASNSRISSPTFGRPSTPSFASAMNRASTTSLRPPSSLGTHSGDRSIGGDDEVGEWVTIVSKFHFVDLAGSERLKRTGAAGERIKEGISINSGLLALGNVISALGDPSRAKTHTATHIPYRDSKLTRLLQDSLGGNAHTLMIACVSPAEYNAAETVNTLKYANRARNIKNRAVLNEKEDGWDDVEWLQGTVTRLRKELKALKEGGAIPISSDHAPPAEPEGASKKVLAQLTDLQNNYEDLREKFVERTAELARLRQELGERHRGSSGIVGGTAKYEEIVGPVIEEYEKTISAMEAELKLNRAALRHTNEMYEEKEDELAIVTERHAATELYVEELRSRVAKLQERESSTEAYIRDLEEKLRSYDENSVTSNESMTDLKREVARFKDTESNSAKYIADLEARLALSDESVITLQQTTERLERECDRRRNEVELLQTRLAALKQDGENWKANLDEREKKVRELELKMEEWERKRQEAGEARDRLGTVVGEVVQARRSLQLDIPHNSVTPTDSVNASPISNGDSSVEKQLLALQQTHTATLADLSSVTAKYRDALREISELAAQIQEAKLGSSQAPDTPTDDKTMEVLPRRRLDGSRSREALTDGIETRKPAGRRLFFRQAASTESLHSRSQSQSQSLSQELSSARTRQASVSSHGTSSSISNSPLASHGTSYFSNGNAVRPNLSISLPSPASSIGLTNPNTGERSVLSLEKEIMRLQEVLKEREAEILVLEESLRAAQAPVQTPEDIPELDSDHPVPNGRVTPPNTEPPVNHLSPQTMKQFDHIRNSMVFGHAVNSSIDRALSDTDESLDRLNELMLSMAQKESHHKEVVDSLNSQLAVLKRQHDDLTALSRDQADNMSAEIAALQAKHEADLFRLEESIQREMELSEQLRKTEAVHAETLVSIRTEHEATLAAKAAEVDELLNRLKEEHATATAALQDELSRSTTTIERLHDEHERAIGQLRMDQESALHEHLDKAARELSGTRRESETALQKIRDEYEEVLRQKSAEAAISLQTTEEEYYNALTKLRGDHAAALERHAAESNASLEKLREEHAAEVKRLEITQQGLLSESQSTQASAVKGLQEEHLAAISRKEASFAEKLETLKSEHSVALATQQGDYELQIKKLKAENDRAFSQAQEEWRVEIEKLKSTLRDKEAHFSNTLAQEREKSEAAIEQTKKQQTMILQEVERGHAEETSRLKTVHESAIRDAAARSLQELTNLRKQHDEELASLNSAHTLSLSRLQEQLDKAQLAHSDALERLRSENSATLSQERDRHAADLASLEQKHAKELESLNQERSLVVQELDEMRAQVEALSTAQSEARTLQVAAAAESSKKIRSLEAQVLELTGKTKSLSDEQIKAQSSHESATVQFAAKIKSLEEQLARALRERDDFSAQVTESRNELDKTLSEQSKLVSEASNRDSLINELEKHRSVLAEMQENLQRVKDEKDSLQLEKSKQDNIVKELQAQVARASSPPGIRSPTRATALPGSKLPPPTPPPTIPPPPAPRPEQNVSVSSQSSAMSSKEPETPLTSINGSANGHVPPLATNPDSSVDERLVEQAKQIEEQEAMIKTLNKQLTHCETDLQAHMDIVSTLETSLGDSEKNLRKARMQATELARERDALNTKLEALRNELQEAKREVATVRRSVVEEKHSLEQRLDEERKAKERVRAQLDQRMDELSKRKSKFACM